MTIDGVAWTLFRANVCPNPKGGDQRHTLSAGTASVAVSGICELGLDPLLDLTFSARSPDSINVAFLARVDDWFSKPCSVCLKPSSQLMTGHPLLRRRELKGVRTGSCPCGLTETLKRGALKLGGRCRLNLRMGRRWGQKDGTFVFQ